MNIFNKLPVKKIKRNWFPHQFQELTTCEIGQLIPTCCEEVLPGDTWKGNTEIHALFMPLVSPVMHQLQIKSYTFFVPNRIILRNKGWETFLTGGKDGKETFILPQFSIDKAALPSEWGKDPNEAMKKHFGCGSLFDHLGFPALPDYEEMANEPTFVPLMPFRVYNLIWNEYFRDETLQEEVEMDIEERLDDSPILPVAELPDERILELKRKCWEKDYFSSALPFTQRGGDVYIPISGGSIRHEFIGNEQTTIYPSDGSTLDQAAVIGYDDDYSPLGLTTSDDHHANKPIAVNVTDNLRSTLENVNATINDLRTAFAVQRYLEIDSKFGYRLKEYYLGHFGERVSDARLQRPQFIAGSTQPLVISQVLQTSQSDATPQGNMSGHAESLSNGNNFKMRFEEHGWLMTIVCVVPRSGYFQGWPKKYSRFDRYDYFDPEFQNLGEQAILNQEVFYDWIRGNRANSQDNPNFGVFGYQGRWNEMRQAMNHISGDIKTDGFTTWHLNRIFGSLPALNEQFVTIGSDEPGNDGLNRIFATEGETEYSHIVLQVYHNYMKKRKMRFFANS